MDNASALIRNTLLISNSGDYDIEVISNLMKSFSPENLRMTLRKREMFMFEEQNEILGTIGLEGSKVHDFFVAPDRQKRGVGSALLSFVEARAKENGVRNLYLAASLTAVRFYKKKDYETTGEEDDGTYGRTVGMRKLLQ